jgi:transposase
MTEPGQADAPHLTRSRSSYRRWSEEEKRQIVAETKQAGTSVSAVARRHNLNTNQLFQWRDKFKAKDRALALAGFVPVQLEKPQKLGTEGLIAIEFTCGVVVRVDGNVDGNALRLVLAAVRSQS